MALWTPLRQSRLREHAFLTKVRFVRNCCEGTLKSHRSSTTPVKACPPQSLSVVVANEIVMELAILVAHITPSAHVA